MSGSEREDCGFWTRRASLVAENYPADTITDAWAQFLKNTQESDGHWKVRNLRPPLESSDIEVTAAALRSIHVYAPKSRRTEYEKAVQSAAQWMEAVQPRDTQDRAFRILGLHWAGGKRDAIIKKAATDLMVSQRPDGGWAQLPTLASDAYATGQALTALHESDVVPISHPAYQRGDSGTDESFSDSCAGKPIHARLPESPS